MFSAAMKKARSMTPDEQTKMMNDSVLKSIERYNAQPGNLNLEDGYECALCLNRGNRLVPVDRDGIIYEALAECKCMKQRQSIMRMKKSGLAEVVKEYTFKRFEIRGPWCKDMLDTAQAYLKEGVKNGAWLFFGGQSGCGKTHICTAVARQLLRDMPLHYMLWTTESKKLRALVNDAQAYERELSYLENIDALYIDDLFKPVRNEQGKIIPPSGPEVRLAFEILNFRAISHKITIISSEWYIDDLLTIDEGTASRIDRCSRGYNLTIKRDAGKNYRIAYDESEE